MWLEATAPLTAVVERLDSKDISPAEVIQGVRTALVLMGNASQYHALQRRKTILQHLNPQLKLLVQDADFADAPPSLFGAKFGEIAKERLEAAAPMQKSQPKATQGFQKRHTQKYNSWGCRGGRQYTVLSRGRKYQAGGSARPRPASPRK